MSVILQQPPRTDDWREIKHWRQNVYDMFAGWERLDDDMTLPGSLEIDTIFVDHIAEKTLGHNVVFDSIVEVANVDAEIRSTDTTNDYYSRIVRSDLWTDRYAQVRTYTTAAKGLKLDGINQYARTGFNPHAELGDWQPFTIMGWVYTGADNGAICGAHLPIDGTHWRNILIERSAGAGWNFIINKATNADEGGPYMPNVGISAANTWYHVAGVFDPAIGRGWGYFYVDAILVGSDQTGAWAGVDNAFPDLEFYSGTYNNNGGPAIAYIGCIIDELRIYDYAMDPADIAAHFNSRSYETPNDAVLGYHFDDTAADWAGTFPATLVNGPVYDTGIIPAPASGSSAEIYVWQADDSIEAGESGHVIFGDSNSRTALDGISLRFRIGGVEQGSFDSSGNLDLNKNIYIRNQAELRFYEGVNYVGFEAPALAGDQIWTWPPADGGAGTTIITDGSGVLSFTANPAVTTAAALTDHAIVRGAGGGTGVQDSGVIIDDADAVTGMTALTVQNAAITTLLVKATGAGNDAWIYVDGADDSAILFLEGGATKGYVTWDAGIGNLIINSDGNIILEPTTDVTIDNGSGLNLYEDISWLGATTENLIKFPDNLAVALRFAEAANPYFDFISMNGSEEMQAHYPLCATDFAKTGWPLTPGVTLSFDNATKVFTVTDGGAAYYYIDGVRYTLGGNKTVDLDDVGIAEGLWYIYFVGDTLTASQVQWDWRTEDFCPVSYVYWDNTNNKQIFVGYEPHWFNLPGSTHSRLHFGGGAAWDTGLLVSDAGAEDVNVEAGAIFDEDLLINITDGAGAALFEQVLSPAQLPIYYRLGATPWRIFDTGDKPNLTDVGYVAAGELKYNELAAGVYGLTNVGLNNYMACYVAATNEQTEPVALIMGQRVDNKLTEAKANNIFDGLDLTGLPFQEMVVLARLILKGTGAGVFYELEHISDLRSFNAQGNVTSPLITSHAGLSQLAWSVSGHYFDAAVDFNAQNITGVGNLDTGGIITNTRTGAGATVVNVRTDGTAISVHAGQTCGVIAYDTDYCFRITQQTRANILAGTLAAGSNLIEITVADDFIFTGRNFFFNNTGPININQNQVDVNFRVDTSGLTNTFKVDGGNDAVGIGGVATPGAGGQVLEIAGHTLINADDLQIQFGVDGAADSYIQFGGANLEFFSAGIFDFQGGAIACGAIDCSSTINVASYIAIEDGNELRFYDPGDSHYVGFEAPALTATQVYVWPAADGNNLDRLITNGAGNLSWAAAGAPGAHKDTHDPEDGADALDTAAAGVIQPDDASAVGTSHSFARADHTHQITCDAPNGIQGIQASAEGTATYFARSDHDHEITHSINDNRLVTVDGIPVNGQFAQWTANGLAGRTHAQTLADLSGQASGAFSWGNQTVNAINELGCVSIVATGSITDGTYTSDGTGNFSGVGTIGCGAITSTGNSQFDAIGIGMAPTIMFNVLQTAEDWTASITNSNVTNSYGLLVYAGNDTNDYCVRFRSRDSTVLFSLKGDGEAIFTGCVSDGTCEIMDNIDAVAIIADVMNTGSGEINEYGHEKFDMERLQPKYPYLFTKHIDTLGNGETSYYDRLGAKSDLLYRATMQQQEKIEALEAEVDRLSELVEAN